MKNREKILIIYDSIDYFIPFMKDDQVDVVRLYKKVGVIRTLLKKAFLNLRWFNPMWYGDWINDIKKYSKVIIFATRDYSVIKYIRLHTNAKIYFWYWNPAFRMGVPKKQLLKLADVWSFDLADCKKYNLKFNTTFFFKNISIPSVKEEYDVLFLGINKGRRLLLEDLNDKFSKSGLKTYFYIVPDKNEKTKLNNKPIPYKDYLQLLSRSRAVLDLQPEGQSGLTLRPMESIFLRKKLITNNLTITKEEFYCKQNIFVIGVDPLDTLADFIASPYKDIPESIVGNFDFSEWLKRFDL